MMTTLKQLRAENRYEESYQLTQSELMKKPEDIWAKRNHSWSLYYMIKKHVQAGQSAQAKHFLAEFNSLQMPPEEELLHQRMSYFIKVLDAGYLKIKQLVSEGQYREAFEMQQLSEHRGEEQLSWIIYYLLKSFNKSGKPIAAVVSDLLIKYFKTHQQSPKLVSKLILQELIKTPSELWSELSQVTCMEKIGLFEILEEDDFQKQEWEGKKIISLAERLHIAYSKALLREESSEQKIQKYIAETVELVLEKYPNMLYVPYFKAKLLLGVGEKESGIKAFLPFAKKKSGEFWVWQIFAEAYEADDNLYFQCLCKAMTCKTKPEFLSNIQERMISYLVKKEMFDLAKGELNKLVQLREKQQWGLKNIHRQHLSSSWYQQSTATSLIYADHVSKAETLLGMKPTEFLQVVVSHINKEKKVFGFLIEENKQGFGKYTQEPILWQVYQLEGSFGTGEFFQIKKQKKIQNVDHPLFRKIAGKFIKKEGNSFGFAEGTFIEPSLVKKHKLKHNDEVIGKAVMAPVNGKKEWALKMVEIKKTED